MKFILPPARAIALSTLLLLLLSACSTRDTTITVRQSDLIDGRYVILSDHTIYDMKTGLQWMRCALGQEWDGRTCAGSATRTRWDEARAQINQLNRQGRSGRNDWRLPDIDELSSLIYCEAEQRWDIPRGESCQQGTEGPTISTRAFPNSHGWRFWSSTPRMVDQFIWTVHFGYGLASANYKDNDARVRPVRDGSDIRIRMRN
ncbi:DUF1566 domain-containing protein [Nitrincola alkalilacustris]|uniref:Lcl C-terminal domain-containing protein n=1 Tax=Nitrincola alkalilacustris TaxID=1571224 RepID=UPI00124D4DDF|nr:DUF1566 domain-containing protein [Nitrincola alkalilacustris]